MHISINFWLSSLCLLLAGSRAVAQDTPSHQMLGFDDKGKLESPAALAKIKLNLAARKPDHVFIISHGWRVSKGDADETVAALAKLLREQKDGESIDVIGIRWPSLLGENDTAGDKRFKQAAALLAQALPKSDSAKEQRDRLKTLLKKPSIQFSVNVALKFRLPDDETIDRIIDNAGEPENIELALTIFTYFEMKRLANTVGSTGLSNCLSDLQAGLPGARFHLVGHSFGCKVCLACLASDARTERKVDSVTLLQGAVSTLCFAPKIAALENEPGGAYVDIPKRVKGCISATHTKNDAALRVAFLAASQAAGQVAELPTTFFQAKIDLYGAPWAPGDSAALWMPSTAKWARRGPPTPLRPGLNAINADKTIQTHGDIRRAEVAWLIWSTARQKP